MGTTEVGNTLGGKSGKMGGIGMGVYTGMGRRQNRWIPIHTYVCWPSMVSTAAATILWDCGLMLTLGKSGLPDYNFLKPFRVLFHV